MRVVKTIFRGVIAMGLIAIVSCGSGGNSGTTTVGNPSISNPGRTLTIGQLDEDGRSVITMGPDVFAGDGSGAVIAIAVNGVALYEDIAAWDYYDAEEGAVIFALDGLTDGDHLTFTVTLADGTVKVFEGTVSSAADSYAELVSDTGDDYDVDEETVIAEGFEALATQNLSGAQSLYCDAYNAGSTDSEVAFGCFLTTFLALPETSEVSDILASLGSEGEVSALEEMDDVIRIERWSSPSLCSRSSYGDLEGVWECVHTRGLFGALSGMSSNTSSIQTDLALDIVQRLIASGTTILGLNDEIYALSGDFEAMENMLEIVVADADFAFEVPHELLDQESDHTVYPTDARIFLAGVKATLVALDITASYDFGFEPENILTGDGEDFDVEALVADLNGTGETVNGHQVDTTAFLTLVNEGLVTASKDRFIEALEYAIEGLEAFVDGEYSDVFNWGDGSRDVADLSQMVSTFEGFLNSVEYGLPYEGLCDDGDCVTLNLKAFFDNPPSATDVTDSDPFVLEESWDDEDDLDVALVESWWRDFFDGIAESH